jgi:8-oxo-dGTP pyrophosphatase MutT (NUDIX family)
MNVLLTINPEQVSDVEADRYTVRYAARGVVTDAENRVALLHVTKYGYHKLPGGGIDEGETHEEALRRECHEEIGCAITVGEALGEIVEYRTLSSLIQHSFCFMAKVDGEKGEPHMEQGEIDDGFKVEWHSLDDALLIMQREIPQNYEGQFIVERDMTYLALAQKLMST